MDHLLPESALQRAGRDVLERMQLAADRHNRQDPIFSRSDVVAHIDARLENVRALVGQKRAFIDFRHELIELAALIGYCAGLAGDNKLSVE